MNVPSQSRERPKWISALGWILVVIVLSIPWSGRAGLSFFLELTGIEGEATDPAHKGEIDVLSWSWGASQSGSTHTGSASGSGNSSVQDLSVTKFLDKSSPDLLLRVLNGKHISEGKLKVVESFAKGPITVQELELENILVTSYTTGGSSLEDRQTENVTLNFAAFVFTDVAVAFEAPAGENSVFWNIPENTGGGGSNNTTPTISTINDQTVAEDTSTTVNFTIGDAETAAGALNLSRSSSNPALIPVGGITLNGEGTARSVTIVPTANASGSSTIGITVDDGALSATETFLVTVNAVNDAPTVDPIPTQTMLEGTVLDVDVVVGDIDSDLSTVMLGSIDSSNPLLLPLSGILFTGTGSTRTMTLTPVAGLSGSTDVMIEATDGEDASIPQSFTLVVNEADPGAPTDIQLSATLIAENSADGTEVGVLTTADPDVGDTHTYSLLDDAGGRFGIGGALSDRLVVADGSLLDFEASSSHAVTVRTEDAAGNAFVKNFTVTVQNVNESPTVVVASPLLRTPPFTWTPVQGVSFADPDVGGGDVGVLFEVSAGALDFDDSAPFSGTIGGNGTNALSVLCSLDTLNAILAADGLYYRNTDLTAFDDTLSMRISDLGNSGTGGPKEALGDLPIEIELTKYEIWLRDYYTSPELLDPAITGYSADSDEDTFQTLFEYLLGLIPTLNEPGPHVEAIEVEVAGLRYPAIRLQRLKPFRDPTVALEIEVATDLSNWAEDVVLYSSETTTDPYEEVVIRSVYSLTDRPVQEFRLRGILSPTF